MGDKKDKEKDNPLMEKIKPVLAKIIDKFQDQIVSAGADALDPIKASIVESVKIEIQTVMPLNTITHIALNKMLPKIVDKMVEKVLEKSVKKVQDILEDEPNAPNEKEFNPSNPSYSHISKKEEVIRLYQEGTALMIKRDWITAQQRFEKITIIDPYFAYAWYKLGVSCDAQEKYTQAIEMYQKTLGLNPQDTETLNNLGCAYMNLDQFDLAEKHLQIAIKINDTDGELWFNLGVLEYFRKHYDRARELFLKSQAFHGDPDAIHEMLKELNGITQNQKLDRVAAQLDQFAKKFTRIHILELTTILDLPLAETETLLQILLTTRKYPASFDSESKGITFPASHNNVIPTTFQAGISTIISPTPVPTSNKNTLTRFELLPGDEIQLKDVTYEILSELGRGGMGIIYLAKNPVDGIKIVIKQLLTHRFQRGEDGVNTCEEYWIREQQFIRIQSQVSPNTMHLIDGFKNETSTGCEYYILLEYIAGTSLDVWFNQWLHPLDHPDHKPIISEIHFLLQNIIKPLCIHLDFVHQHGIIHRDITPKNILIRTNPIGLITPILIDWGVAKEIPLEKMFHPPKPFFTETRTSATGIHSVGNPPEVVAGYQPMATSDIYMMGFILHYLLCGGRLPPIPTTATEYILHPALLNPAVPPPLDQLVAAMTQYEPADRISTFSNVIVRLTPILTSPEVPPTYISEKPKNDNQKDSYNLRF